MHAPDAQARCAISGRWISFPPPHAHEYTQQLMDEFSRETDPGLRRWLLELLAETKDPNAFALFLRYLYSDDRSLKTLAIRGLKHLNTKEARRALWEAGI